MTNTASKIINSSYKVTKVQDSKINFVITLYEPWKSSKVNKIIGARAGFFFSIWKSRLDGEVIATVRVGYFDRQQHAPADF